MRRGCEDSVPSLAARPYEEGAGSRRGELELPLGTVGWSLADDWSEGTATTLSSLTREGVSGEEHEGVRDGDSSAGAGSGIPFLEQEFEFEDWEGIGLQTEDSTSPSLPSILASSSGRQGATTGELSTSEAPTAYPIQTREGSARATAPEDSRGRTRIPQGRGRPEEHGVIWHRALMGLATPARATRASVGGASSPNRDKR